MSHQQKPNNNSELLKYAGLGTQILASLGVAVFVGYKLDKWTGIRFPLFVWLLPFAVLCILIYSLIRQTSRKK